MAQEFVAGAAQETATLQPVLWKSRRWGKASFIVAWAGLMCSIIVFSRVANGVHVFVVPPEPDAVAAAQIELMGKYLALLALAVFLLGCGVVGYMYRAQK